MEPYQVLEQEFARWNDLDPAGMVCCSSGTAALHLALEAMRLPPGSEILVPDYTMVACPRAVTLAGLVPVFVDCDKKLLLLDPIEVGRLSCEAEGLLVVHVYGRRFDLEQAVRDSGAGVGGWNNLYVVEDLAEAHGIRPHSATDAACWSFYKNKIVAGEEGGAVWFRDLAHAALARQLRTLGFTEAHDYIHVPRGHNYRLSNAHARIVLESLRNAGHNILARRRIEQWYDAACPNEWRMPPRDVVWVYDVHIPGLDRERMGRVVRRLNEVGIAARHGFLPMSAQNEFRGCRVVGSGNARKAAEEVFYLPVQPGITTEESVRQAFEIIREVMK